MFIRTDHVLCLFLTTFSAPLWAQHPDAAGSTPTPDPVKGWPDPSPLTDAELALLREQRRPHAGGPAGDRILEQAAAVDFDRVLFDDRGDGRIWAACGAYKTSFGPDGFTYIPFLGSDAPQNWPVQWLLRSVRVGGRELPFARAAQPVRTGQRVTFDRGSVREVYDLSLDHVEQTFVVDAEAGDVEVELEVVTELVEDAAADGIQFGNARGSVGYGTACLVDGAQKRAIATTCAGNVLRLQVPGSLRTAGAVVIDPIITTTRTTWTASLNGAGNQPDVAYDATTDCYLLVQEHVFSGVDTDLFAELIRSNGVPVPGSRQAIDITIADQYWPRAASLNLANRFLIVLEQLDTQIAPGLQRTVWGRTMDATAPYTVQSLPFQISEFGFGDCVRPDVGGDSGNGGRWTVVWTAHAAANDFDILARQVDAAGVPLPNQIPIETTPNSVYSNPQISQSNGAGYAAAPRWLIVFQYRFSPTDWDIYAVAMAPDGAIAQPRTAIDLSVLNDNYPYVSSPATDWTNGDPVFMVTYERQNPTFAAMGKVVNSRIGLLGTVVPVTNLSQQFGLYPFWVRVDSDGNRFAVTSGPGSAGLDVITVATLGVVNGAFVLHEAPQVLAGALPPNLPFDAVQPAIAAKRGGGGGRTDYGVSFVSRNTTPPRAYLATYRGHGSSGIAARATGCGAGTIDIQGTPVLGEAFVITAAGNGLAGMIAGTPTNATLPFCPGCTIGVSGQGQPATLTLIVPLAHSLVGLTFSFQGWVFDGGPCLGAISLTNTLDVTLQ